MGSPPLPCVSFLPSTNLIWESCPPAQIDKYLKEDPDRKIHNDCPPRAGRRQSYSEERKIFVWKWSAKNPHSITGSKSRQSQVEEGEKEREEKTEKERVWPRMTGLRECHSNCGAITGTRWRVIARCAAVKSILEDTAHPCSSVAPTFGADI